MVPAQEAEALSTMTTFKILAPAVTSGGPEHIRFLFIVAGRESEFDDSGSFPIDFSKMKDGGLAAACPAPSPCDAGPCSSSLVLPRRSL